jgi:hypothetical protein
MNSVLRAAPGDEGNVYDLPIARLSDGSLMSCWEVDAKALMDIAEDGKIFLHVLGRTHPPLLLLTKPAFTEPAEPETEGENDGEKGGD